jgi:hypothetical protein
MIGFLSIFAGADGLGGFKRLSVTRRIVRLVIVVPDLHGLGECDLVTARPAFQPRRNLLPLLGKGFVDHGGGFGPAPTTTISILADRLFNSFGNSPIVLRSCSDDTLSPVRW